MKLPRIVIVGVALISICFGQTQPNQLNGMPPQGSYGGSNVDTINLMNGNLALHIPLPVEYPQRGKLAIKYYLVTNAKTWRAVTLGSGGSSQNQWLPTSDCSVGGPCGQGPVFVSTASITKTRSY
jgi:hypothetical protein